MKAKTSVPYEVACSCGGALHGQRQPRSQIVSCPHCGRKRFILPSSPWPGRGASASPAAAAQPPTSHRRLGRLVLVIVAGGLAAMALLFFVIKPYLRRSTSARADNPATVIRDRIEAGQQQLRSGNVHLALKELNAAAQEHERHPDSLNRDEYRALMQLRQESDLLANLLDHSLEEVLRQAMQHRDDEEWRAKFADYRGRWVVFDDVLRRDATGSPMLAFYVVRAGEVDARVALEDLPLLRQLPLDLGQRWLFGARLASCRREEGGVWVLRFDPDSAVLLTDEDVAAACYPGPLDAELRVLLRRQEEWLRR